MTSVHIGLHALVLLTVALDQFGAAVSGCGDLDRDGVADFLIGDSSESTAWVVSGKNGSVIRRIKVESEDLLYGAQVSAAGDLDGDGFPDVLVGERSRRVDRYVSVNVVSGKDGRIIRRIKASQVGGSSPVSIDGTGDLNGDGYLDILIGWSDYDGDAAGQEDVGCIQVYSGRENEVLLSFWGIKANDRLGRTVCFAGDVDGDEITDVLAGSYGGYAKVISGRTGSELYSFEESALKAFGILAVGVGDINNDSHADIAVRGEDILGKRLVIVYSGENGKVLFELSGPAGDGFGASVSGIRDLDGDGVRDLIVGSDDGFVSPGKITLYSGRDRSVIRTMDGVMRKSFNTHFGASLGIVGDIDGDGREDFVVGNNRAWTGSLRGSVHMISGGKGVELYWLSAESVGGQK